MSVSSWQPLSAEERTKLIKALRGNVEDDQAILMDGRDTSFAGTASVLPDDEEVVLAIRSVPCHYGC